MNSQKPSFRLIRIAIGPASTSRGLKPCPPFVLLSEENDALQGRRRPVVWVGAAFEKRLWGCSQA